MIRCTFYTTICDIFKVVPLKKVGKLNVIFDSREGKLKKKYMDESRINVRKSRLYVLVYDRLLKFSFLYVI